MKQPPPVSNDTPKGGPASWAGGLGASILSALLTAFLLLVNGSLTLVLLAPLAVAGPEWYRHRGFLQFLLFMLPVFFTVLQWMLWDWLRGIASREKDSPRQR